MFHSTIDGLWARNTLSAITEFSVLRMKTNDFNDREISEWINDTILAGDMSPTLKIEPAPVPVAKLSTEDDETVLESFGSRFASDLPDCLEYRHPT